MRDPENTESAQRPQPWPRADHGPGPPSKAAPGFQPSDLSGDDKRFRLLNSGHFLTKQQILNIQSNLLPAAAWAGPGPSTASTHSLSRMMRGTGKGERKFPEWFPLLPLKTVDTLLAIRCTSGPRKDSSTIPCRISSQTSEVSIRLESSFRGLICKHDAQERPTGCELGVTMRSAHSGSRGTRPQHLCPAAAGQGLLGPNLNQSLKVRSKTLLCKGSGDGAGELHAPALAWRHLGRQATLQPRLLTPKSASRPSRGLVAFGLIKTLQAI